MIPITSTEMKPLEFSNGIRKQEFRASGAKIGWLHSKAPEKGVTFDLTIKDGLGRAKFTRKGCGNESQEYGELVNLPTLVGENLTVEIENLKGAESLQVFLN